jgi:tetratricopeptide (TPR) repeat protein
MDNDLPRLVVTISNYASTLSGLGRLEEAAKLQQEAAEIYGELGQSTKELAMRGRMAGTLARQGNVEDAEQKMRLVIAELENLEGPDHPEAVTLKVDLAVLLQAKGRYKESEPLLEECLSAARRVGGRLSTYELLLLDRLSKTKYSLDKFDEAVECTRTLLPLIRESRGEDSIAYWGAHANLASFLISAGKAEEGEKIARFARDNLARIAPEGCYFTPHALETLADALNAQKKYRDEIPPLEAAYAHYTSDAFADREAARVVAGRLMQAYEAIADTESAAIWRARYTDEPETTELPAELPANGGT